MHPLKKAARIAGAIYLSMVITGPFSLLYVPEQTHRARKRHRDRPTTFWRTRPCFVSRIVADLVRSGDFHLPRRRALSVA